MFFTVNFVQPIDSQNSFIDFYQTLISIATLRLQLMNRCGCNIMSVDTFIYVSK